MSLNAELAACSALAHIAVLVAFVQFLVAVDAENLAVFEGVGTAGALGPDVMRLKVDLIRTAAGMVAGDAVTLAAVARNFHRPVDCLLRKRHWQFLP